jgi:hypothetical protein
LPLVLPVRRSALALLLVAAALPPAASALPSAGDAATDGGIEVAVLPLAAPKAGADTAGAGLTQATLDVEARTDAAFRRIGFRSLRVNAVVDCSRWADRVTGAEGYARPGLSGQGRAASVGGAWSQPAAGSLMASVVAKVCAARAPDASAPRQVVDIPAPAPAAGASGPPPEVVDAPAQVAVAAAQPPHVDDSPAPPTPRAAKAQAAFAPPPAALRPTKAQTAYAPAPPAGPVIAQLAASPNARDANLAVAAVRKLVAPPLTSSVEPAVVGDMHVWRASVAGFSSAAAASAFCKRAAGLVGTCWVRPPITGKKAATQKL